MKEQSQIEEMRAAVRGDRERAEQARRRSQGNAPPLVEPEPAPVPPRAAPREPEPEPAAAPERRRGLFGLRRRR